MNFHYLREAPEPWLSQALQQFEKNFTYPLGSESSFQISHGASYLPFFQAMGEATVIVAEMNGTVLATLAIIRRELQQVSHDGECEEQSAWYVCDLKLHPNSRQGILLARLFDQARNLVLAESIKSPPGCYSVVMKGTGKLPTGYTGRLGIPVFRHLAEVMVLRISANTSISADMTSLLIGRAVLSDVASQLRKSGMMARPGTLTLRSEIDPQYLVDASGQACAVLEDTRRGKRLLLFDAQEMLSAHLSQFSYGCVTAATNLITNAIAVAQSFGLSAVFVAVPFSRAKSLITSLSQHTTNLEIQQAPATVFGCHLPAECEWWVDTAEI